MNKLYKIIITKDPDDGRFIAEAPTLKPCVTWGNTLDEAMTMIREAIEGVVEYLESEGLPVPDDSAIILLESQKPIHTFLSISEHEPLFLETA